MQTNPLYAQDYSKMMTFQDEVHVPIQAYAQSNTALYNPCVGELCIAKYGEYNNIIILWQTLPCTTFMLTNYL